jgi:hypothetical protein
MPGHRGLFAVAALCATTAALAADIRVPEDYATIQGAIDAAPPGARIVVAGGTYYENLTIGKSITLASKSGAGVTTLDGARLGPVVFARGTGEEAVDIVGFTIANGLNLFSMDGLAPGSGSGVHVESLARSTIRDNVIRDNVGCLGVGIHSIEVSLTIVHNQILNNPQDSSCNGADGGGIIVRGGASSLIASNLIAGHVIGGSGGGIKVQGGTAVIRENVIRDNVASSGGAITFELSDGAITNNLLVRNSAETGGALELVPIDNNHVTVIGNTLRDNQATTSASAVHLIPIPNDALRMLGNTIVGDSPVELIRCETPFTVSRSNLLRNPSGATVAGSCTFGLIF